MAIPKETTNSDQMIITSGSAALVRQFLTGEPFGEAKELIELKKLPSTEWNPKGYYEAKRTEYWASLAMRKNKKGKSYKDIVAAFNIDNCEELIERAIGNANRARL